MQRPPKLRRALEDYDVVVVGAGPFGLTIAERVANELHKNVCVLERRKHLGGNCYSEPDAESGIECHKYGSHIFHTKIEEVWEYLNRFTTFSNYRHRVLTVYKGQVYSMPINLGTICSFFGRCMSPGEAKELIDSQAASAGLSAPVNLEEKAISSIGRPLYEAFVRGYTKKQWGVDPRELPPDVIVRLPVRFNFEPFYFSDPHEGIPVDGYTAMFQKMADSPQIDVRLGVDFMEARRQIRPDQLVVYSGPIDRYFDYRLGELGWRTLDFQKEVASVSDFQGAAVVNYADEEIPYTRIHEFKHFHGERDHAAGKTVIYREFSRAATRADEPYYPLNLAADKKVLAAYAELAARETHVIFGGRLGAYKYLDMDKTVDSALRTFREQIVPFFGEKILPFPAERVAEAA
jgi:UDP-galactopyranose mutase